MFRRILLTTDFSKPSLRLIDLVVMIARKMLGEVFLLHVDEEESMFSLHSSDDLIHFFREIEVRRDEGMEQLAEEISEQEVSCTRVRAKGVASEEILKTIDRLDIDLVAIATVGVEGSKRILIGSTCKKVLRNAPCSVLTVNPEYDGVDEDGIRKILFPYDFSREARTGVHTAARLARMFGADLELLRVLKVPTIFPSIAGEPSVSMPQGLSEMLVRDSEGELSNLIEGIKYDRVSRAVTIGSDEAESIADHAADNDADLVVISRGGENAIKRFFFGRVSHGVAKLASVPVLSLPLVQD